jgi:type IV secretory pathway VirB3-like protein
MFQSTIALVSGLLIVAALFFGMMAMAIAGLVIGFAGAVLANFRQPETRAVVTLEARRMGNRPARFFWRALSFVILRRPSRKRGETGGPSGAKGDLYCRRGAWSFALRAPRGSPVYAAARLAGE